MLEMGPELRKLGTWCMMPGCESDPENVTNSSADAEEMDQANGDAEGERGGDDLTSLVGTRSGGTPPCQEAEQKSGW